MNDSARAYLETEKRRVEAEKEKARRFGFELLTPLAAVTLVGISDAAVRTARLKGRVHAPFTMSVAGKDVHLLHLRSAIEYWGGGRSQERLETTLNEMRDFGFNLWISNADGNGGIGYNILHPHPLVSANSLAGEDE